VATIIWIVGSVAFSYYVRSFGSYNETFGALGGVIVLLLWLWLSAYIILLGAELDSEMERVAKRTLPNSGKRKAPHKNAFRSADSAG